uniref:Interleukin-4 receptor alpha N-terminal domain-containing protein n=1 Tax=Cyprinus carpio TaxID=7962 RepID=A0A8C2Q5G0_CYPCA
MFPRFLKCQIISALICHAFCYEPTEEDLKCFNDYEKEMKCSLSTDRLKSCSGYKLNISRNVFNMFQEMYACIFERSHNSDKCECRINVKGFVITEIFTTTLLEGSNVLLSKTSKTEDFIKPKTPVLSVQKTENGNFYVTWDDQYKLGGSHFLEDLKINLAYGIKGELEKVRKMIFLYGILSADIKSSLYIVVINIIYYSNNILFSFQFKHIKYYIYECNKMCISITGLGLKFHIRWY